MNAEPADKLSQMKCKPCEGGVEPWSPEQAKEQLRQLDRWELSEDGKWIRKQWDVKSFIVGMDFLNRVADLAQRNGHHPDIHLLRYRKVVIELTTHAIKGLSENDFILAAKIDQVFFASDAA